MGYAFISYSSKQQADADKLRLLLQNNHIDTWMAPHDLPQGADYADVINDVIRDAACVVLLLTEDTQSSVFVDKEIERALHYGKTIAPIQLGKVELNDSFAFYLCNQQIAMVSALDESMPKMQALLRSVALRGFIGGCGPGQTGEKETAFPAFLLEWDGVLVFLPLFGVPICQHGIPHLF